MSVGMTIVLGIVGSVVGNLLGSLIFEPHRFELGTSGIIGSIIGAIIGLGIFVMAPHRRRVARCRRAPSHSGRGRGAFDGGPATSAGPSSRPGPAPDVD